MSIYTNDPLTVAFLKATKLSVPRGATAMKEFMASEAFREWLIKRIAANPSGSIWWTDEELADMVLERETA